MDRRRFFKITGLAAMFVATHNTSILAAGEDSSNGSMLKSCRITVLRRECFSDLQSRYLDDPDAGPCSRFKTGQEFVVNSGNYQEYVSGKLFCPKAWACLQTHVDAVLSSDGIDTCGLSSDDRAVIACCPDGTRPVVFKITPFNIK